MGIGFNELRMISIFVAYSKNRAIGNDNGLPWYIPEDLKHFKELTTGHAVIMGRKTYESIVDRLGHPLPNRRNIVISSSLSNPVMDIEVVRSLKESIELAAGNKEGQEIFIIGGERVFRDSLELGIVDKIYATEIDATIVGDVFFPEIIKSQWTTQSREEYKATNERPLAFAFVTMRKAT